MERHPYTEPAITSTYVSRLRNAVDLAQLGLRPAKEGGKLWLQLPDDEGVLTETQSAWPLRGLILPAMKYETYNEYRPHFP